jgi:Zn ribbon nucleic-acid-binding protein
MRKKPCSNHRLAMPSDMTPEGKNIDLVRCIKCGWWIKRSGARLVGHGHEPH